MLQVTSGAGRAKAPILTEAFHKIHVCLAAVLVNIRSKSVRKISYKTFRSPPHSGMVDVSFLGGSKDAGERSRVSLQTEGLRGFSDVDCCLDLLCFNRN